MKKGRFLTSVVAPLIVALVIAFAVAALALLLVDINPLTPTRRCRLRHHHWSH